MWKKIACLMILSVCCVGGPCGTPDSLPMPGDDPGSVPAPATGSGIDVDSLVSRALFPPSPLADPGYHERRLDQIGGESTTLLLPRFVPEWEEPQPGDSLTLPLNGERLHVYKPQAPWQDRERVSLIAFSMANLPKSEVTRALLILRTLSSSDYTGLPYPALYLRNRRLSESWSENQLPSGRRPASVAGIIVNHWPGYNQWMAIDITSRYLHWLQYPHTNFGVELFTVEEGGLNIFHSTRQPDIYLRPRLLVWGKVELYPRFKFPLAGKYNLDRINGGGDFGSPWDGRSCAGDPTIPLVHTGVDLRASADSLVYAAEQGKVVFAGSVGSDWGQGIAIETVDYPNTWSYHMLYEHIDPLVTIGTVVQKGQQIGRVANLGARTHLHFSGAWGKYTDPRGRLPAVRCATGHYHEADGLEKAFPGDFWDPKKMAWEE